MNPVLPKKTDRLLIGENLTEAIEARNMVIQKDNHELNGPAYFQILKYSFSNLEIEKLEEEFIVTMTATTYFQCADKTNPSAMTDHYVNETHF